MPTTKVTAGIRFAIAVMNVADVSAILSMYRLCPSDPLQYHMYFFDQIICIYV